MSISIDSLQSEILKALADYSDDVARATKKAVDKTAREALKVTKSHLTFENRTGEYERALKLRTAHEGRYNKRKEVYASGQQYHLTHLLEYGHGYKISDGHSKAFPHFKYGDEYVQENFEENIKKEIDKL